MSRMRWPASKAAAATTAALCCACQVVNRLTPALLGAGAEVVDLAKRRGRRLFEQDVEAGVDAVAGDLVARAGRGGDRDRIEAVGGGAASRRGW